MRKLFLPLIIAMAVLVSGCGRAGQPAVPTDSSGPDRSSVASGGQESSGKDGPPSGASGGGAAAAMPMPAPMATQAPRAADLKALAPNTPGGSHAATPLLQAADRMVISTGSISLEVAFVQPAIGQIRAIAEGLGGFVEQLSSSGNAERQNANITVRVPQQDFYAAVERIQALGKVTGQNMGSQDVSEQYIDLTARLKSARTQEASYLTLLSKATSVNEILTIERELTRVRAEVERLQGQLAYLDKRIALASINVSLTPPARETVAPPAARLTIAVDDVTRVANEVKAMVSAFQGIIDSSSLTVKNGQQSAAIVFRVFSADFDKALSGLEGKGTVESKDIQEGGSVAPGTPKVEKPDARFQVNIVEPVPGTSVRENVAVGVVLFLAAMGLAALAFFLVRRLRRKAPHTA